MNKFFGGNMELKILLKAVVVKGSSVLSSSEHKVPEISYCDDEMPFILC